MARSDELDMADIVVIGAGPAGVIAALRAADLGARATLVTASEFGGMAANDGPVPVRVLAHAARLLRATREVGQYGITVSAPLLDYPRLLARAREVVSDAVMHSSLREQIDALGVRVHENAGATRFLDPHTIVSETGLRLKGDKFVICTGGIPKRLPIPGFGLTTTHSGAFSLPSVPPSMLVIGGGATGVQVASIFDAFGSRVELFATGSRILATEDEDVAKAVEAAFRKAGIAVHNEFGAIDSFEKTSTGVRMRFSKDGNQRSTEAALAVVAAGWVADTAGLNLSAAGVDADHRGFVKVDEYLRTSTNHIFAAGDVTGRLMLVPPAIQDGFVAATNAVLGSRMSVAELVNTSAGFTDPEYAGTGITEANARETHDVLTTRVRFDSTMRTIIDGRTAGFCKLVVDRRTAKILGCHVVGERAVEIAQVAAIAISSGMRADQLAQVPLAFPTYVGNLAYAAAAAARELELNVGWQANRMEGSAYSVAPRATARPSSTEGPKTLPQEGGGSFGPEAT
jgi:dihydrolipoamide dehydrogenase